MALSIEEEPVGAAVLAATPALMGLTVSTRREVAEEFEAVPAEAGAGLDPTLETFAVVSEDGAGIVEAERAELLALPVAGGDSPPGGSAVDVPALSRAPRAVIPV